MSNNIFYCEGDSIDDVILSLQDSAKNFQWFSDNQMKGNTDRCHSLLTKNRQNSVTFR